MSVNIIAEAGINHNGDMGLAKKLIDVASDSGADMVKFQTYSVDRLLTKNAKKAEYQNENDEADNQYEMLRPMELSIDMHKELIGYCKERDIGFLSSAFDCQSVDLLVELGVELLKVPSGEITNLPYLRQISAVHKPVIMSTGMSTMDEIREAVCILESGIKREKISLMHCNTEYPSPFEDVNLNAITSIKTEFGLEVGYSDHTPGTEVPIAAVALGASTIEKHITLDKNLPGPDHKASLEPNELKTMISSIRNIEKALGDGIKVPSPSESKNICIARKSIFAQGSIKKGETLTEKNIAVKRPGNGVSPMLWDSVLGTEAIRDFNADEAIEIK
jgi:N,N'-diacetyllegionaminate synthase